MSDVIIILTGLMSILVLVFLAMILYKGRKTSKAKVSKSNRNVPVNTGPAQNPGPSQVEAVRVGNRRVVNRRPNRPIRQENEEEEEDYRLDGSGGDDYDELGDQIALPDGGKIGAKKRKKLEMKAEKRAAREQELEEREEKKKRQAMLDEKRRLEEEKEKAEEKAREEAERIAKEEKERREYEEYLKLKETFAVEEEGYEHNDEDEKGENKLKAFIDYIKRNKVVLLEDLAGMFQMRTQDVIKRVNDLLEQETLVGVIDDRGKFIYITKQELESVAKFIKQRGRISISELVESSNKLIKLQPSEQIQVNT